MIFIQVIIGGTTRLTESGLSITEWNVVMGSLPPMNDADWQEEFAKYKQSPQYQKVNLGMSLDEFKSIYFWEWFHRLYGRLLGFVFLIPFIYFLVKRKLNKKYLRKSLVIFVMGGIVGVFGWIMVASGLHDRPMVSPYRLAVHLSLAILTLCYSLWVALELLTRKFENRQNFKKLRSFSYWLTGLISVQIMLGALVSGMRAAKYYPSWPDMNGEFVPSALLDWNNWSLQAFAHFDSMIFPNAFVQFFHRNLAYLISILVIVFVWQGFRRIPQVNFNSRSLMSRAFLILPVVLVAQVLLGIFTLIHAIPGTPVALGVTHQAVAIVLLANLLCINFKLSKKPVNS